MILHECIITKLVVNDTRSKVKLHNWLYALFKYFVVHIAVHDSLVCMSLQHFEVHLLDPWSQVWVFN